MMLGGKGVSKGETRGALRVSRVQTRQDFRIVVRAGVRDAEIKLSGS
jgi:hypothetical protein